MRTARPMSRTNIHVPAVPIYTHQGGPAHRASLKPINQLQRSVLSCMLWEDGFYEDGQTIVERIRDTAKLVTPAEIAALARIARTKYHLRHAPLLLVAVLADVGKGN